MDKKKTAFFGGDHPGNKRVDYEDFEGLPDEIKQEIENIYNAARKSKDYRPPSNKRKKPKLNRSSLKGLSKEDRDKVKKHIEKYKEQETTFQGFIAEIEYHIKRYYLNLAIFETRNLDLKKYKAEITGHKEKKKETPGLKQKLEEVREFIKNMARGSLCALQREYRGFPFGKEIHRQLEILVKSPIMGVPEGFEKTVDELKSMPSFHSDSQVIDRMIDACESVERGVVDMLKGAPGKLARTELRDSIKWVFEQHLPGCKTGEGSRLTDIIGRVYEALGLEKPFRIFPHTF